LAQAQGSAFQHLRFHEVMHPMAETPPHDLDTTPIVPTFDPQDVLEWELRPDSVPFWRHAVAGSCAGIGEHLSMYPLDTVKTQMQAMSAGTSGRSVGLAAVLRTTVQERGLTGLYRGASVVGAGCIPAHVGLFSVYELAKSELLDEGEVHQPVRAAACGAAGATVHDVILTPMDVVKQRLQLGAYGGPLHCFRTVVHVEGFRALYRSLPVTLASNAPYTGVLVAVNESLKLALGLGRGGAAELPWYFFTGGVGGVVAAVATLPLDVVKTRLQTHGVTSSRSSSDTVMLRYTGFVDTVRSIARMDGIPGFFRGLVPRMLLAAPMAGICWGTYDTMMRLFGFIFSDEVHLRRQ